jgi:hypothetical protein
MALLIPLLLGFVALVGDKCIHKYEIITLIVAFIISVLIQILLHRIYPIPLWIIINSDKATSFYSVAMRYSPLEILSGYLRLAPSFPKHAMSNMPGKILLFQFFGLFTKSPQKTGYEVIFISTLGAFLIYSIAKYISHNKRAAFFAFLLYVLIPAKLFFFPILNTVTPFFIFVCLYLFILFIEKKNVVFLWLLGFSLYLMVLFEPSLLVTGLIFVGILVNAILEKRLSRKDIFKIFLYTMLAFLCTYAIFLVIFSFDLLQAFLYIMKQNVGFNASHRKDYWLWIVENIKEFLYSAGTPIILSFFFANIISLIKWRTSKGIVRWSLENMVTWAMLVTFGVVLFSGVNRGEVSRLWIYLAACFPIPAALFISKVPKSMILFLAVAFTLVIQALIGLQNIAFVAP